MNMRLRRAAGLLALVSAAVAPSVASAQVFGTGPWTGLYLGVHGGYAFEGSSNGSMDGGVAGAQVGYNLQLGPAVLGIEADYSWSQAKDGVALPGINLTAKVDSMWSVRGRLGAAIGSSLMIYGTAGYGGYDVSLTGRLSAPFATVNFAGSAYTNSLVVGAGAELMLTRNILIRAEGLHYTNGAETFAYDGGGISVLRLGASYKF